MNTKNNQRFRDSELRMAEAMLSIMKHTELSKITVRKICEQAGVNRSTFYAHFSDIYDMIDKMEMELRKELIHGYRTDDRKHQFLSTESFLPFLKHIKKHRDFYKINLQTRTSFPLPQGFEPLWSEHIKPVFQKAGIRSENKMMYYFVYFQAGFTMVLKRWVDTGCQEPETEVASIIRSCLPPALLAFS